MEESVETCVKATETAQEVTSLLLKEFKALKTTVTEYADVLHSIDESAIEIQNYLEKIYVLLEKNKRPEDQPHQPLQMEDSNSLKPHAPYPDEALNKL
ncbi:MAG: hypothetical protein K2Q45_03115 [Nitrosomonas sp.]|nr:hypothetical protein [Nitrosomonas sp.]